MAHSEEIIIVGSGGHARIVIDAAENAGFKIHGIIDINYKGQEENILSYPILGDLSVLKNMNQNKFYIALAIGDNLKRTVYFNKTQQRGFQIASIIHPTAIVSKYTEIKKGVFVGAGAIVNAKVIIGENTIVNTGAILEHEVVIGKHSHVGPGSRVAGRVQIGEQTLIGIGSSIIDKISIGDNVTIGAGSVILNNIESNSTVVGVPGKKIR